MRRRDLFLAQHEGLIEPFAATPAMTRIRRTAKERDRGGKKRKDEDNNKSMSALSTNITTSNLIVDSSHKSVQTINKINVQNQNEIQKEHYDQEEGDKQEEKGSEKEKQQIYVDVGHATLLTADNRMC